MKPHLPKHERGLEWPSFLKSPREILIGLLFMLMSTWVVPQVRHLLAQRLVKAPRVAMTAVLAADTVTFNIRWTAVKDARGSTVARYLYELRTQAGATYYSDSVAGTVLSATVKMARPLPGDTVTLRAAVAARDSRNVLGFWGYSAYLVVPGKPWTPPPAPNPTLDTVAVDSIKIFAPFATLDADSTYHLWVNDTTGLKPKQIQLCGMLYLRDGRVEVNDVCQGLGVVPSAQMLHLASMVKGFKIYDAKTNLQIDPEEGILAWDSPHAASMPYKFQRHDADWLEYAKSHPAWN